MPRGNIGAPSDASAPERSIRHRVFLRGSRARCGFREAEGFAAILERVPCHRPFRPSRGAGSAAAPLDTLFVDLGMSPLCESFLAAEQLDRDGAVLPAARAASATTASWCSSRSTSAPEQIFTEYAYFSSYSTSWLEHARALRRDDDRAASASDPTSLVVELASNDGYLLQYFVAARHPGARHRAGGERRARRPKSAACRRCVAFFGAQPPRELVARGRTRRPRRRQQRAGAGAGPQRLRRRHRDRC